MSDIGFYVNRARQAYSRVSAISDALAKNPADMALRASLVSARRLAARADADALDMSREKHIDVVRELCPNLGDGVRDQAAAASA